MQIVNMKVNDSIVNINTLKINGTNLSMQTAPIPPGKQITFDISFSHILNKTPELRGGMVDDSAAFISYFFPRLAVYDDIDGWNQYPYAGGELYNDFCDF